MWPWAFLTSFIMWNASKRLWMDLLCHLFCHKLDWALCGAFGPHLWIQEFTLHDRHWKTSMEMLAVFLRNASVGKWCYLRAPTVTFCIRNTTHDSHGAAMGPLPAFLCLSSVTWTLHAKRQRFALFETKGKLGVYVKVSQWLYLATSLKSLYWYNKTL